MVFIQEIIYLKQRVGAYIINLEKNESIESHWVALYVNAENLLYFARFRVKHIGKKITILIGNKNVNANTYKMQVWILLLFSGLLVYTNLSFPNGNKKNEK